MVSNKSVETKERTVIIRGLFGEFRSKINWDKVSEICSSGALWLLVASAKVLVLSWV